jgi:hypothetical protein
VPWIQRISERSTAEGQDPKSEYIAIKVVVVILGSRVVTLIKE